MDEGGLVLGLGTRLVRLTKDGRLAVDEDRDRMLALLSVAHRRPVSPQVLGSVETAALHWKRGDKALANLRLVFAGLPRLDEPADAWRLRLAEALLDEGLPPRTLLQELDLDPSILNVGKFGYNPNQPRVPAGNGPASGRWAAIWNKIVAWLEEPVPEYDTDTGIQVGTRTRGRAIATDPVTVGVVGTGALLGGEAVVGGAVAEGVSIGTILPDGTVAGADALGATPNLARLGAKFGINAESEVGANILRNLNTPVKDFISQYRLGSIMRQFPSEHLESTVGQALEQGGSKVRKRLSDSRFAK